LDFNLSEEQVLLRESVAGYLSRHYSFDARRGALGGAGWRSEIWRGFADELGLFGAALPESLGGFGGGAVETMLICEEFGRALVLEPYIESVVLGVALLDGTDQGAGLLGGVVDGTVILAPALYEQSGRFNLGRISTRASAGGAMLDGGKAVLDGGKAVLDGGKAAVVAGPIATHFLVSACDEGTDAVSLFLVAADAQGLERRDYALIDGRIASDLAFNRTAATRIGVAGDALPRIERAIDAALAALCAEAVGVMDVMLKTTVDYAQQRKQFGVPISSFQVLQHRMVDMFTHLERARSLAMMATLSLDLDPVERRKAASAAKAYVSKALKLVGEAAIQIHGGIGTTEDIAISHYFKRATVMQSQFGTASHHLERMAA
jgi:alkylation response protein AidB-like acyl-CoA dehydrogenase